MFQNNLLMAAASISTGAYTIDNSCRFNTDDTANLSISNGTSTSNTIATIAFWFKIGIIANKQTMFGVSGLTEGLVFDGSNKLYIVHGAGDVAFKTTQVFRDTTAWYHCVVIYDTTESVDINRVKLYINGVQVTAFTATTWPTEDSVFGGWNKSGSSNVVGRGDSGDPCYDGYLSEFHSIDGVAYGPTTFGEFDDYGVWRPIDVTGVTYGNNGFYLDFTDSSNLGNDVSGNDNDLTSSGLVAADQMTDTPTNNHATWNVLNEWSDNVFSDGNLTITTLAPGYFRVPITTIGATTGKFYCEMSFSDDGASNDVAFGIDDGKSAQGLSSLTDNTSTTGGNFIGYKQNGEKYIGATTSAFGATYTVGDVIGIALDLDDGTPHVEFYKNNSSEGTVNLVTTGISYFFAAKTFTGAAVYTANFGQSAFTYTPPTGFVALNTANLATPTIKDGTANFQPTLYTGDGSVRNIDQTENSTFQPDWVWIKSIASAHSHMLIDAPRGVTKQMHSNSTAVETTDTDGLTSFDSDGFGLGTGSGGYNDDTETFVAWQWLAGGGAGSSNEAGTINTTTTTVNTTAGISIGTYTGTGVAATIGHGLGVAPQMVIVKERANDVGGWYVYHEGVAVTDPETDYLLLNIAAVLTDDATVWNDTAPTSTVFSIGTNDDVNGSTDTYVYYAFASVEGFSKFGSYTGNGDADGPFIYTGFKPSFVVARGVGARDTFIYDSQRSPYNVVDAGSYINEAAADYTGYKMDFLSNGFKIRTNLTAFNVSGEIIIFWAFAEYPFGGDGVTPATAF